MANKKKIISGVLFSLCIAFYPTSTTTAEETSEKNSFYKHLNRELKVGEKIDYRYEDKKERRYYKATITGFKTQTDMRGRVQHFVVLRIDNWTGGWDRDFYEALDSNRFEEYKSQTGSETNPKGPLKFRQMGKSSGEAKNPALCRTMKSRGQCLATIKADCRWDAKKGCIAK